jgi:hypothetical protein
VSQLCSTIENAARGRDLGGVEWSFCEEFTDLPTHLRRGDAPTIGWYVRVCAGQLEVRDGPVGDAAFRLVIDYQTALTLAHLHLAEPEQAEEHPRAFGDGRIGIEGEGSAALSFFADLDLHDRMAEMTL